MTVSMQPLMDPEAVRPLWMELERRAEASFFLSWHWIGCWLRLVTPNHDAYFMTVTEGTAVVGLAVFVRCAVRWRGMKAVRQWRLHETGDPDLDRLTIEYNGILADRDCAERVVTQCFQCLGAHGEFADEVVLSGVERPLADRIRSNAPAAWPIVEIVRDDPCYAVDLAALRATGQDYLAGLSANSRYALRRSIRLYEAAGPLRFQTAGSVDEALQYFAELKRRHEIYWSRRGERGAFTSPFFEPFHAALIREAFPAGHVQLCRISAGDRPIGYLYNFLWRGCVYAYQSGFDYDDDARLKPGLTSHYLAIAQALASGYEVYDFMAGDGQHKRSLARLRTHVGRLALRPDRLQFRAESWARRVRDSVFGRRV